MKADAILNEVKNTRLPQGMGAAWWLGQMGLLIKLGETVLCIDHFASPAEGRTAPPPIPACDMEGVDVFLGTHDHLDHIDHEAWRIWAKRLPNALFLAPRAHRESLLLDGIREERLLLLNDGESVSAGGVTVRTVAAAHEFLDRDEKTGLYPFLQYVLEGNGVRVWHAGDTVRYEGMLPKLKAMGPIDLGLLPINGRDAERYSRNCIGNMTFQEAADLAGELNVRLALPGHFDMMRGNLEDPDKFTSYLTVKYGGRVPCLIPQYGQRILFGAPA